MNNARRTEIRSIIGVLDEIGSNIELIRSRIEDVKSDEQDAFDNMPESLHSSERGEASQAALDNLDSALSDLPDIDELIATLGSAAE
jgi:hypothetical protein